MIQRLITHWVYGGFLAGILLLALSPLLLAGMAPALAATFLLLPAYMVHQYEEHDADRFRRFFNETLGQGREALTPWAVFLTNVPGVWGVIGLSFFGAVRVDLGWALVAVYLVLVNAVVHIVHGVVFRRYNPGLGTALAVFLPLGTATLWMVHEAGGGAAWRHGVGLASAVGIHAAILVHVRRRVARLRSTATGTADGDTPR